METSSTHLYMFEIASDLKYVEPDLFWIFGANNDIKECKNSDIDIWA